MDWCNDGQKTSQNTSSETPDGDRERPANQRCSLPLSLSLPPSRKVEFNLSRLLPVLRIRCWWWSEGCGSLILSIPSQSLSHSLPPLPTPLLPILSYWLAPGPRPIGNLYTSSSGPPGSPLRSSLQKSLSVPSWSVRTPARYPAVIRISRRKWSRKEKRANIPVTVRGVCLLDHAPTTLRT